MDKAMRQVKPPQLLIDPGCRLTKPAADTNRKNNMTRINPIKTDLIIYRPLNSNYDL